MQQSKIRARVHDIQQPHDEQVIPSMKKKMQKMNNFDEEEKIPDYMKDDIDAVLPDAE